MIADGARRGGQARPLGAEQQREARGRRESRERRRAGVDDGADHRDAVGAQRVEIAGPALEPRTIGSANTAPSETRIALR